MKCFKAPPPPVLRQLTSIPTTQVEAPTTIRRNPILQSQPDVNTPPSRYSKARIPQDASQTRYLAERPRGLAKGSFSDAGKGSFSIGKDQDPSFKPTRRPFEAPNEIRPEKLSRKKMIPGSGGRDPILQTDTSFESEPVRPRPSQDWRPSTLTEYVNQRKNLLPSELGVQKLGLYEKRNKSSVFSDDQDSQVRQKRRGGERQDEAPAVLQYKYALPYRDTPITEKPQNMRVQQEYDARS